MSWSSQCPSRGPGLKHVHDPECPDGHASMVCCECGRVVGRRKRNPPIPKDTTPERREYSYDFTDEEAARLDFVAYLVSTGRLKS